MLGGPQSNLLSKPGSAIRQDQAPWDIRSYISILLRINLRQPLQATCSVPAFSWWKNIFLIYIVWTLLSSTSYSCLPSFCHRLDGDSDLRVGTRDAAVRFCRCFPISQAVQMQFLHVSLWGLWSGLNCLHDSTLAVWGIPMLELLARYGLESVK